MGNCSDNFHIPSYVNDIYEFASEFLENSEEMFPR